MPPGGSSGKGQRDGRRAGGAQLRDDGPRVDDSASRDDGEVLNGLRLSWRHRTLDKVWTTGGNDLHCTARLGQSTFPNTFSANWFSYVRHKMGDN
ncbi:hypothetical protein MRX96_042947 [Rhipicephalus microplus]